jgi:anti-anti-sigma factor
MISQDRSPRSNASGSPLDLQVSYRLGVPLIYVKGELDHDTAGYLREAIEEERKENPSAILLEFSGLAYMDSGGLSLMFEIVKSFQGPGGVGVVGANSAVSRLLEITGLADHPSFSLFADQRAAAVALGKVGPS